MLCHELDGASLAGRRFLVPAGRSPAAALANVDRLALALSLDFLFNTERNLLGGPCKECGKYYVMNSRKHYSFCTQDCGKKYTYRKSNGDHAHRERKKKIARARRGVRNWSKTIMDEDWRVYARRTEHISKNFLTRSRARKEIIAPKRPPPVQKRRH